MNTQRVKGAIALGSLTATVALLAGLGSAQAQIGTGQAGPAPAAPTSGPGAGSFPPSFLFPGTDTSLSLYGQLQMGVHETFVSQHTSETTPSPTPGPPGLTPLLLEGPGPAGGTSFNQVFRSIHGG